MARPIHKLSALKIANLTKSGRYCDGNGLWLQVAPGGTKSWVFRYHVEGKRHEVGLGSTALVSLADARAAAQTHRQLVHGGHDPLQERQRLAAERRLEAAKQITFSQCAAKYIAAHRAGWRNEKHAKQWEATLKTYAAPVIGDLPVGAIDTQLVLDVLEPIWTIRTETATRVRGRIEAVLDWAKVKGYREGDNPARWRGHLDQLLAAPRKVTKVENHPALAWREAPAFFAQLRKMVGVSPRALEYLILTAARSAEARGTAWHEIDEKEKVWSIPAERMKAGRVHRVPLSPQALALLRSQPCRTGLVFCASGNASDREFP